VDAEPPCLIVRRGDDATPVRVAAHDERPAAQGRLLELLDGRKKGVEIEVREDR
jgi:hypothetical protein